jgi:copper chaperone CopZ
VFAQALGLQAELDERPQQVELKIHNMASPYKDGNTVRNALCSVQGVSCCTVDFAQNVAVVRGTADVSRLLAALQESGYTASMTVVDSESTAQKNANASTRATIGHLGDTTSVFEVAGMTCGACVTVIENVLLADPGVVSAHIALLMEKAEV